MFNDKEKNDFFENADVPEPAPKPVKVKKPEYTPDDPRYWDEPEDEFEHIKPSNRTKARIFIWIAAAALIIGLIWGAYLRYFHPYIRESVQYGYVEQIAPQGNVIETYEGVLLPYRELMDSTRKYESDFVFSTKDAQIAATLKKMQYENRPVRITYKVYHTALPWRGNSKVIVTAVDTVEETKILPPDLQPETLK